MTVKTKMPVHFSPTMPDFIITKRPDGIIAAVVGKTAYSYSNNRSLATPYTPSSTSPSRSLGIIEVGDAELVNWINAFKESVVPEEFIAKLGHYATGKWIHPEFMSDWLQDHVVKKFIATKTPDQSFAITNMCYVNPRDYYTLTTTHGPHITITSSANKEQILTIAASDATQEGYMMFNYVHRTSLGIELNKPIQAASFIASDDIFLGSVSFKVEYFKKVQNGAIMKMDDLETTVRGFTGQIFQMGQEFLARPPTPESPSNFLKFTIVELMDRSAVEADAAQLVGVQSEKKESKPLSHGVFRADTAVFISKQATSNIKLHGASGQRRTIFSPNWNFEDMGIGGLDDEFSAIFRRAFASRVLSPKTLEGLNIQHVKGMLLHGPPGTGKTLIARQIGKMLVGKEPKVVNGPEILNKYVGASEENIRKLFEEASEDYAQNGENAELHIIIMDEIDAICKTRGSSRDSTGVHDTVVNQLLSMIDGVNSLNNILVIGMTNRKDMIDEALLRPGRLEVQVEISLPDESGREQILRIHTKKARESQYLADDVDLKVLATNTKNFSGAEIEGLVKSAVSFAFNRLIDARDLSKKIDETKLKVTMDDFLSALGEVKPAFGVSDETVERFLRNDVIDYGQTFKDLMASGLNFVQQVKKSRRTPRVAVLLHGAAGAGKSAVAAKLAVESEFPYVQLVSAETMVGVSELGRCNLINKVFEDAYKSPFSVVIIDDLERLIDYVPSSPVRFSNAVLQALMVLVRKEPPTGKKLLILGTTSHETLLRSLLLVEAFDVKLHVPKLDPLEAVSMLKELDAFSDADLPILGTRLTRSVALKKLYLALEMAESSIDGNLTVDHFMGAFDKVVVDDETIE